MSQKRNQDLRTTRKSPVCSHRTIIVSGLEKNFEQSSKLGHTWPSGISTSKEKSNEDERRVLLKCLLGDKIQFLSVSNTCSLSELQHNIQHLYKQPILRNQLKYKDGHEFAPLKDKDLKRQFDNLKVPEIHVVPLRKSDKQSWPTKLSVESSEFTKRKILLSSKVRRCRSQPAQLPARIAKYGWGIKSSDLYIPNDGDPLGSGFFGQVRVGYWLRMKVACKFLYGRSFQNKSEVELFIREISLLSELRHPNVILYLGTCVDRDNKIIVMEYMDNGSLSELLQKKRLRGISSKPLLSSYSLLNIAKDVVSGMKFLHENKVLHRDLSSKNILLNNSMQAKVADFGLSRRKEDTLALSNTMGAVPWMSPEVLENPSKFGKRSDVYSFAITLWECFTGEPPYYQYDKETIKIQVLAGWRPTIPSYCPPEWANIIQLGWDKNPLVRPHFKDILGLLENIEVKMKSGEMTVWEDEKEIVNLPNLPLPQVLVPSNDYDENIQ